MTISKSELRRLVRDRDRSLPDGELRAWDWTLTRRFLVLPDFVKARRVLLYFGVGPELDTRPLIASALDAGKVVALPRVTGPGTMEAGKISSLGELVPGAFGIPEPPAGCELLPPEVFDLILVPGTAFTPDGRRLGRGGGFYDRYLIRTRGMKVALARGLQLMDDIPTEATDISVDLVITGFLTI